MEGINLNASMNKKTDNVFDFIEEKLAFGVGDWEYYLTPIGSYIVNGSPFGSSLSEWANEYGLDEYCNGDYESFEKCPESTKTMLQQKYLDLISSWLQENNLSTEDLKDLDLLNLQYQAIVNISHGKDIEKSSEIIADTKTTTGKNCLEYLVSLRPITGEANSYLKRPWTSLSDRQGTQLCAVLTGIDPFITETKNHDDIIEEDLDDTRSIVLSRMHAWFEFYKNVINKITFDKVNSDIQNQGIINH